MTLFAKIKFPIFFFFEFTVLTRRGDQERMFGMLRCQSLHVGQHMWKEHGWRRNAVVAVFCRQSGANKCRQIAIFPTELFWLAEKDVFDEER